MGGSYFEASSSASVSSASASAPPSPPPRSPPSRAWPSASPGPRRHQQHRLPDGDRARRRDRHDGCSLALGGLPGGERRCESARRTDRGFPIRLPGLRRPGRDRRGAGGRAPWPVAGRSQGTGRARRAGSTTRIAHSATGHAETACRGGRCRRCGLRKGRFAPTRRARGYEPAPYYSRSPGESSRSNRRRQMRWGSAGGSSATRPAAITFATIAARERTSSFAKMRRR